MNLLRSIAYHPFYMLSGSLNFYMAQSLYYAHDVIDVIGANHH